MEKIAGIIKTYLSKNGRMGRGEFCLTLIVGLSIISGLIILVVISNSNLGILYIPLFILYWWLLIVSIIKRFHDMNESGQNILFLLLPIINLFMIFLLIFSKGSEGKNKYDES